MYFNRFTQGAKTAINLGKSYAKGLGHRVVGTEHLVVGLLREKDGIAARVLKSLGIDINTFENKLVEIEGRNNPVEEDIPLSPRSKQILEKRGASHVRCNCCRRWPCRKYRRKGTG